MHAPKQEDQVGATVASAPVKEPAPETSAARSWTEELDEILDQAAMMAAEHDVDPDQFMAAAHAAFLRANPELQEHLERAKILAQMDFLRRMGILAQA